MDLVTYFMPIICISIITNNSAVKWHLTLTGQIGHLTVLSVA